MLEAIAGPDPQDGSTHPEPFSYNPNFNPGRRYRIGVPRGVLDEAADAVKENFEAAIEALKDMADVEEMGISRVSLRGGNFGNPDGGVGQRL